MDAVFVDADHEPTPRADVDATVLHCVEADVISERSHDRDADVDAGMLVVDCDALLDVDLICPVDLEYDVEMDLTFVVDVEYDRLMVDTDGQHKLAVDAKVEVEPPTVAVEQLTDPDVVNHMRVDNDATFHTEHVADVDVELEPDVDADPPPVEHDPAVVDAE